jgi:hypothetical protein
MIDTWTLLVNDRYVDSTILAVSLILSISGELGEGRRVVENVLDEIQVHHCICIELAADVQRNDVRALLPAVLKLLQVKVAERQRVQIANDSKHAALLSGMVVTAGVEGKRRDMVME